MTEVLAKNGEGELSQAQKLAVAERFKTQRATGVLADGRVITINMRPKAEVVPIKRDVLMVADTGL